MNITLFQLLLDPDELWHYNYCMNLPHVKPDRRAVVDKVIALVAILCNAVEFVCYLLIFRLQYLNNKKAARDDFSQHFCAYDMR